MTAVTLRTLAASTRKIICVGRNYALHAPQAPLAPLAPLAPQAAHTARAAPLLFLKPPSALLQTGGQVRICKGRVEHEVELAVIIQERLSQASLEEANAAIGGYAVAIDVTARSIQAAAAAKGQPWTVSKGLDTFCPMSEVIPAQLLSDPHDCTLYLRVNSVQRQYGSTQHMLWRIPELLQYISSIMTLEPHDIVLTGTPEGAGPLEDGDVVDAGLVYKGAEVPESMLRVTPEILYSMFIPFGEIVRVELPRDENSDEPHQGFGYVEFKEEGDAWDAIDNMDQSEAFGRVIYVTRARAEKTILEGLGSKIPVWEQEAWIQRFQVNKDDWKAVEQQKAAHHD
ncbi:hypothetical protein PORY_002260 [Pneumocystis oryctolagi]|uniref:Uncharacterized protein n=1 Tax=Pneumocystis oryctolagi TaxID=42067 RepID=A0ACB7CB76_9ASCO|nr:hypothetical protein PORY_002260 [Pneumocystis oryctolagi]